MPRLLLSLVLLVATAGPAGAETVFRGAVTDARLAVGPSSEPVVALVSNGVLSVAARGDGAWPAQALFILPSRDAELDGLVVAADRRATVLVRGRDARWLAIAHRLGSRGWGWLVVRPGAPDERIGPAGLALDRADRPVIAYAVWRPSRRTSLRLLRLDGLGRGATTTVTRNGFPPSPTLPAAAPVVLATGEIRVVEAYAPAAIEWRPAARDWVGQFVHSSALGAPTGRVLAAASGSTVYAAWTEAYPTLGPPAVVLATHGARARSAVALENAVLAALAVTPEGPELAANRCFDGVCGGLVGDVGVDGLAVGLFASGGGTRDLLLAREGGLEWYRSPARLERVVTLARDLSGRVAGAAGGSITLYRERAGTLPVAVGTFAVAGDGSFAAADPTAGAAASAHRAVYVDPLTSIPYAALVPPTG